MHLEHVGPYSGCGSVFEKVMRKIAETSQSAYVVHRAGLDSFASGLLLTVIGNAGLYFDDPNCTEASKCRAYCGALIPGKVGHH